MMNKGLELIEAHYLFDMPAARLDVLIHPQSIVHSLVEYVDGSVLAQLGNPDMRVPIAHALGYPDRIASGASLLDLAAIGRLDFEAPDEDALSLPADRPPGLGGRRWRAVRTQCRQRGWCGAFPFRQATLQRYCQDQPGGAGCDAAEPARLVRSKKPWSSTNGRDGWRCNSSKGVLS